MTKQDDGVEEHVVFPYVTLRDFFAGQALVGLLPEFHQMKNERLAWQAYGLADAMILERNKEQGDG